MDPLTVSPILAGGVKSLQSGTKALTETAKELESLFLSLVVKELRGSIEPTEFFAGDKADVYGGLFDLFLSKHLMEAGGIGIADSVLRQSQLLTKT